MYDCELNIHWGYAEKEMTGRELLVGSLPAADFTFLRQKNFL
jgi:hypothetical protein